MQNTVEKTTDQSIEKRGLRIFAFSLFMLFIIIICMLLGYANRMFHGIDNWALESGLTQNEMIAEWLVKLVNDIWLLVPVFLMIGSVKFILKKLDPQNKIKKLKKAGFLIAIISYSLSWALYTLIYQFANPSYTLKSDLPNVPLFILQIIWAILTFWILLRDMYLFRRFLDKRSK